MRISIPKLKALILYFATYTNTRFLGKVKLMKLIYFADFAHVKTFGAPITFDDYVHLEHGPIPSAIKNLVDSAADDVDASILSDTITFEKPEETKMCRVLPARKFTESDKKLFSSTELEILERICARFGDKNTLQIEEASHAEAPWVETSLLETIPYELAAKDPDCKVSREEITLLLGIHA